MNFNFSWTREEVNSLFVGHCKLLIYFTLFRREKDHLVENLKQAETMLQQLTLKSAEDAVDKQQQLELKT